MPVLSPTSLLTTIAESTRLRLVNCLAAAPLFVSDLQAILDLPQPTVSRHLTVLRHVGLVRDTQVGPFVLYRLCREGATPGCLPRFSTRSPARSSSGWSATARSTGAGAGPAPPFTASCPPPTPFPR